MRETIDLLPNEKLRLSIYKEISPEAIVKDLKPIENVKEYRKIRLTIENEVNKLFEDYIKNYSDKFKKAFNKGDLSQFDGSDEEKEKLVKLIYSRNRVLDDVFLAYVEKGGLSELVNGKDLNDILALLKANLSKVFDKIFVNWFLVGRKYEKNIPSGFYYAGVNEKGLVSYFDLIKSNDFQLNLGSMFNENLKKYIAEVVEYSKHIYTQEEWNEIQTLEVPIWKDSDSKLGVVLSQEAYILENSENGGKLVEPHIALYLKENFSKEKQEAKDLFIKYFGDDFNVSNLNTYLVELLFEAGSQGFRKIAGESVPNSEEVAKITGRINLIIPSRLESRILDAVDKFSDLTGRKVDGNYFSRIVKESDKFVKFHEMGHSMFKGTEYDSNLEELKADLGYYLKLFDEMKNKKSVDIEAFIGHFIIDVIRVFRSINIEKKDYVKSRYRYIVSKSVELSQAIRTGFLEVKNDKLYFNEEKFKNFVERLVEVLFQIKKIYDNKNKISEKDFLEKYDFKQKDVWKIVELANS